MTTIDIDISQSNVGPKKMYRCQRGHEIYTGGASWITLQVITDDMAGNRHDRAYNYCMDCFGEDMVAKFPLVCVSEVPVEATKAVE